MYIAQPYANPFSEPEHPDGSLIALYVIVRFPVRGVTVKVAGKVSADPITGRLVTTFEGVPSLHGPSLEGFRRSRSAPSRSSSVRARLRHW